MDREEQNRYQQTRERNFVIVDVTHKLIASSPEVPARGPFVLDSLLNTLQSGFQEARKLRTTHDGRVMRIVVKGEVVRLKVAVHCVFTFLLG